MSELSDYTLKQILEVNDNDCVVYHEDTNIEFKSILDWEAKESKAKYLKEIAAFANSNGGYLVFGIDNETRKVIGLQKTKDVDSKLILDSFRSYFTPAVRFSSRTFKLINNDLFIIYIYKRESLPIISIKDYANIIEISTIYYRYSGEASKIRYPELIEIFNNTRSENTYKEVINKIIELLGDKSSANILLEFESNKRKIDVMPEFKWIQGMSNPEMFNSGYENIGERATILDVVELEENMVNINYHCKTKKHIEKGEEWTFYGTYKKFGLPNHQRKAHFRLIFQDKDGRKYSQDFKGDNGAAKEVDGPKDFLIEN